MANFPSGAFSDVVLATETYTLDISAGALNLGACYEWLGCQGGPSWLGSDPERGNWYDQYGSSYYQRHQHSVTVETRRVKTYNTGDGYFRVADHQVITSWTITGTNADGSSRTVTRTNLQAAFPAVGGGTSSAQTPCVRFLDNGTVLYFVNNGLPGLQTAVANPGPQYLGRDMVLTPPEDCYFVLVPGGPPGGAFGSPGYSYAGSGPLIVPASVIESWCPVASASPIVRFYPGAFDSGAQAITTGYAATLNIQGRDGYVSQGSHLAQGYAGALPGIGGIPGIAAPYPSPTPSVISGYERGFELGVNTSDVVWPETIPVGALIVTNTTDATGKATGPAVPIGTVTTTRGNTSVSADPVYQAAAASVNLTGWGGYRYLSFDAAITTAHGGAPEVYLGFLSSSLLTEPHLGVANSFGDWCAQVLTGNFARLGAGGCWYRVKAGANVIDLAHPLLHCPNPSSNYGSPPLAGGIGVTTVSAATGGAGTCDLVIAIDLPLASVSLSGMALVEKVSGAVAINSALLNGGYYDGYAGPLPLTGGVATADNILLPDPTFRLDPPGPLDQINGQIEETSVFSGTGIVFTRDNRVSLSVPSLAVGGAHQPLGSYATVQALVSALSAQGNGYAFTEEWMYDDFAAAAPLNVLPQQDFRHSWPLPATVPVTIPLVMRGVYSNLCPWHPQALAVNQMPFYQSPTVTGLAYDDVLGGPATGKIIFQAASAPTGSATVGVPVPGVGPVTATPAADGSFTAFLGPIRTVQTFSGQSYNLPFAQDAIGINPFTGFNVTMTNASGQTQTQYFPFCGPFDFIGLRLSALPYGGKLHPWNAAHPRGHHHKINENATGPDYNRSDFAYPSAFTVVDASPARDAGDVEARVAVGPRWQTLCVFARARSGGSDVYTSVSHDDGQTWNPPSMAIAGGTHPTISVGHNGVIVVAAFVSGEIMATIQQPGDASPSAEFTFVDQAGTALAVSDDTFHFVQGHSPSAPWILHVVIAGESSSSEWASYDECATWQRIGVPGPSTAQLVTAASGTEFVTAAGSY